MRADDKVKLFGLNNISIEGELQRLSKSLSVDLVPAPISDNADSDYLQFTERLRAEARLMAKHYEVFYCLENYLRDVLVLKLADAAGANWWTACVPPFIQESAEKNRKKEQAAGVTPRSSDSIDYLNFGELGEIIKANWQYFGDTFKDLKALEQILARLNTLRGPIAHCKMLAEDEVLRLRLSLNDLFRQMGA